MLIKKLTLQNVRSFLAREEITFDGSMNIIIGPNGGGKTNLLDTLVTILRRYLFSSMFLAHSPTPEQQVRYEFRHNDSLGNMTFDRHSDGVNLPQIIEISVEVSPKDMLNMNAMQADADQLIELSRFKYVNLNLNNAKAWSLAEITAGMVLEYKVIDGAFQSPSTTAASIFLQYLQLFEIDGALRDEFKFSSLALPLVYLPVNRTQNGFQSTVELASYNDSDVKRQTDIISSKNPVSLVNRAVGLLAQKYRLLLENDNQNAAIAFRSDPNLIALTEQLKELGYDWNLRTINANRNQYDIELVKQNSRFLVSAASSGERELLTYLFAIFALNVRDAIIIVDEPELHLHPRWQKSLLQLFSSLSVSTGNQFLLATHSPTFISPESIPFVSRVYSKDQRSHIHKLDASGLPESKHLLNIINSQNNERLFFADEVVLVEGLSDRIFFEKVFDLFGRAKASKKILEVISVGGKGLFSAYARILLSCDIPFSIIADLDYIEQVGTPEIKQLFSLDKREIKLSVIDNVKSLDGETLVEAIESAISSRSWNGAAEIWEYIKSRRRMLKKTLTDEERVLLKCFIETKRDERVFILSEGPLEAYLPSGHFSKDIDKLIKLLGAVDFWNSLPSPNKEEIELIAKRLVSTKISGS
ncbi:MAG: AAA family ATPase [Burkholderiaceae bacterium]|nr:AAA family ATPase [Burkholderiaceae bacterium]